MDAFTAKRITRFIEKFRDSSGVLPTLEEFEKNGFPKDLIEKAVQKDVIELFYVTLTSGTIVKGYKIKQIK
jgi:acyl CoA:acetate/3-ketoacid CoA transferase alpha subunit